MPTPFQYPLERSRALQEKWLRLLHQVPPQDPYDGDNDDDDKEEDEAEEELEPAVIREPDKDE
jgi:hypothetical protein